MLIEFASSEELTIPPLNEKDIDQNSKIDFSEDARIFYNIFFDQAIMITILYNMK